MYLKKYFLGFCFGMGYVISICVVKKLYDVLINVLFFLLEDVYIGFCFCVLWMFVIIIKGFNVEKVFFGCIYYSNDLIILY